MGKESIFENNGSKYTGQFKNGMKHGRGRWVKKQGVAKTNTYEGDYFMDKKHGYGVFNWASGNIYKGNYKDDERHGYGEMFWIDGSIYKGEWIKGIQHGYGEMVFPGGSKKIGMFDHNTFVAPVEDNIFLDKQIDWKESRTQEKQLNPLNKSFDIPGLSTTKNINASFSKNKLKPISTPGENFSRKKKSTPNDISFDSKLLLKDVTKHKMLPPLDSRGSTQARPRKRGLNGVSSNSSFEVGDFSNKALKLLEKGKTKLKTDKQPIWKPSGGKVSNADGYNTTQKLYY